MIRRQRLDMQNRNIALSEKGAGALNTHRLIPIVWWGIHRLLMEVLPAAGLEPTHPFRDNGF